VLQELQHKIADEYEAISRQTPGTLLEPPSLRGSEYLRPGQPIFQGGPVGLPGPITGPVFETEAQQPGAAVPELPQTFPATLAPDIDPVAPVAVPTPLTDVEGANRAAALQAAQAAPPIAEIAPAMPWADRVDPAPPPAPVAPAPVPLDRGDPLISDRPARGFQRGLAEAAASPLTGTVLGDQLELPGVDTTQALPDTLPAATPVPTTRFIDGEEAIASPTDGVFTPVRELIEKAQQLFVALKKLEKCLGT